MYEQTTLQQKRETKTPKKNVELQEFEKMHSEMFLYFIEQYEKWKALKEKQ